MLDTGIVTVITNGRVVVYTTNQQSLIRKRQLFHTARGILKHIFR